MIVSLLFSLKKTHANHLRNPVLTYLSLSLLVLSLFVLLTACDDRNKGTGVPAKTTAPVNPATSTVTVNLLAGVPTYPTPSAADETFAGQVADKPSISFSPQIVAIGQSVEISGKGYPANTRLNIRLASTDFTADGLYAAVLTDETGAFTTSLKLENSAKTSLLTPGKVEISVTTTDSRIGASAPLALQPASNATQDEACKNLVLEFFATLKRDARSAQVYLSTDLRSQITGGKTSLDKLLGTEKPPLVVEITRLKDATDSYQATLFFSGGEQKSVVLDVATDVSGALKISAIRAK